MNAPRGASVLAALLVVSTTPAIALAAVLPTRATTMTWDKTGVLKGVLPYRDALEDKAIQKKISDGLPVTLVMRGYVIPVGGGDPLALTVRSCRITLDLWNEVYLVAVDGAKKAQVSASMDGVLRRCADAEQTIVARSLLPSAPNNYTLVVRVEVNPVSEAMLKQIQAWVTRGTGTSGAITPGDALFSSFVGVFMKQAATADKVVEFQTGPLPI